LPIQKIKLCKNL